MRLAVASGLLAGLIVALPAVAQLPELPPLENPQDDSPSPSEAPRSAPDAVPSVDELDAPRVLRGPLRDSIACPTNLADLTPLLIRDLPTYANRVLQRSLGEVPAVTADPSLSQYRPSYVLLAGQSEAAPLDITDRIYTTDSAVGDSLEQLFFTTLERTYNQTAFTEIVHYHWLFLAPVEDGWRLVSMFSAIDARDSARPILPPQESSNGSVGRGVTLWLRDCRAGAIAG
ncbi:MAG: hypothetical protein AAFU71_04230 [Cyanobacteria bacterium J06632_22]